MTAAATRTPTFEEFLALPETEPPSEYICGEVVQKTGGELIHGALVSSLCLLLGPQLLSSPLGTIAVSPRHAHRAERRVYLPDIAILLHSGGLLTHAERTVGPIERIPDIVIEVLSPDDRPSRIAEKVNFYMRAGVPLLWVIDPLDETLDAFVPGAPATHYTRSETATGAPALPAFTLSLDDLFGTVETMRTPLG